MKYSENSNEVNTAIIKELTELGLELKAQEKQCNNEFYLAGLEVAKQLIVKRLKAMSVDLIHQAAEGVKKD